VVRDLGHDVIVANPRELPKRRKKNDREDAEYLARTGRSDPKLLKPVKHRDLAGRRTMSMIRGRAVLVEARTRLVNHVRGTARTFGCMLRSHSTECFADKVEAELPAELSELMRPVLATLRQLTTTIRKCDRLVERVARRSYPETARMQQVDGVGWVTALTYLVVVQSPERFPNSRVVASYLGLCPKQQQSGDSDPQLRITKAGDRYLRTLLVGSAHYILGPFGPDCDLRRWGMQLMARGGKNAKKRAAVAVARKLSVVLLRLWRTGDVYERLRNCPVEAAA
jgi:transposase